MERDDRARGAGRSVNEPKGLPLVQDFAEDAAPDAEMFGRLVDRQTFANDQADRRPIQSRFHAGVVLFMHCPKHHIAIVEPIMRRGL